MITLEHIRTIRDRACNIMRELGIGLQQIEDAAESMGAIDGVEPAIKSEVDQDTTLIARESIAQACDCFAQVSLDAEAILEDLERIARGEEPVAP